MNMLGVDSFQRLDIEGKDIFLPCYFAIFM